MVGIPSVIGGILPVVIVSGGVAGGSKAERHFIGQGTIQKNVKRKSAGHQFPSK